MLAGCATGPGRGEADAVEPRGSLVEQARAWKSERRCGPALELLRKASWREPESAEPHHLRGDCLFDMGRYPEAAEAYRRALFLDPERHGARVGLWTVALAGAAQANQSRVRDEIRAEIQALVREHPRDAGAALAAAQGYGLIGDGAAADALLAGLAEGGDYRGHEAELGDALYWAARGERDGWQRLRLADLSVTVAPRGAYADDSARLLFGTLTQLDSPEVVAWRTARRYLELDAGNPGLTLAVAWGLVIHRQDPLRADELLQGLAARGDLPTAQAAEARYLHGVVRLRLGDAEGAAERFRAVLALDPGFPRAHHQLGMLAAQRGRTAEAVHHLREALRGGDPLPGAEEKLRGLLARQGVRGDPRDHFARREGVPRFADVTRTARLGGVASERLAWGDYDADGYPDLLLDGPRLFRNDREGGFREVTAEAGLGAVRGSTGGLWGDYDADGDADLFLYSRKDHWLLANDGRGRFEDVTVRALPPLGAEQTEAAAWGDLDNDGFLDLYLANYERPFVVRGICHPDRLLRNRGDGRFEDWTARGGIATDEPLCGRGVVWADVDADGRQDVLVSNYRLDPNLLWLNRGDGTFADRAREKGFRGRNDGGYYGHSIGAAVGDLDGDGHLDVYVANLAHPDRLAFSDLSQLLIGSGPPDHVFEDRFGASGIAFEETSSEPSLGDLDNDGDLDLFVTSVYRGRQSHLYLNDGVGRFTDVSWVTGTRVANGWGAGFADYDRDGRLDLAAASGDGVRLFRNLGPVGRWLEIGAGPAPCPGFGPGSRFEIDAGDRTQVRLAVGGKGTGSQEPAPVHVGLGAHEGPVEVRGENPCGGRFHTRVWGLDRRFDPPTP